MSGRWCGVQECGAPQAGVWLKMQTLYSVAATMNGHWPYARCMSKLQAKALTKSCRSACSHLLSMTLISVGWQCQHEGRCRHRENGQTQFERLFLLELAFSLHGCVYMGSSRAAALPELGQPVCAMRSIPLQRGAQPPFLANEMLT